MLLLQVKIEMRIYAMSFQRNATSRKNEKTFYICMPYRRYEFSALYNTAFLTLEAKAFEPYNCFQNS